jgi:hypothetical protein
MTDLESRIIETLESWTDLSDFPDLLRRVTYCAENKLEPNLVQWARLADYQDLITVVGDFLQNEINNVTT